jgi:hypothetical protein
MYNFDDQEEEEEAPPKEKLEENEQLKEKMKQLRGKMEKLTLTKKVCSDTIFLEGHKLYTAGTDIEEYM